MATLALLLAAEMVLSDGPARVSGEMECTRKGLYTDAQVERLVGEHIDKLKEKGRVLLRVVPSDKSYSRSEIFEAIGIEEARLRDRRWGGFNMRFDLYWQISPSYDICFMTASNGIENRGLDLFDPKRKVYVHFWIEKRTESDE